MHPRCLTSCECAAVLEAEAFGPYKRPDYKALLRRKNAAVMSQGETLQHSLKGSEAGIEQPQLGANETRPAACRNSF